MTIANLTYHGYVFIGMDHFAKPNDELAIAQQAGELHRNFQGYTTKAGIGSFGIWHDIDQYAPERLRPEP